jgi:hypothetical protein
MARNGSPTHGKGVSFIETATDKEDNPWKRENSTDTSPLVTDSCSDSDETSISRAVL